MGVTYDAGALIAAERGDRRMWALHAGLLDEGAVPVVPAAVLAQVWRGGEGRQADLARLLRMCEVEVLTEDRARRVGLLVARSGHTDVVDVCAVEGALRRGDSVVSSDTSDVARVAEAAGVDLDTDKV